MVASLTNGDIGRCALRTCLWGGCTSNVWSTAFGCAALCLSHLANGPCCGVGRVTAVFMPVLLLQRRQEFSNGIVPIMTWGGLKGGISVALALSLPVSEWKPMILAATYVVVIFSIIVQVLTIAPLAKRLGREPDLL